MKVLYIASSSYSGSTLLSFLLNTHPAICTVGEMDGWNYGKNETFLCSCGKPLHSCAFFQVIAAAFAQHQLPFDVRDFGTRYTLVANDRLNRYLTTGLPGCITNTFLETWRDRLVAHIPPFAQRLAQQDRANVTFIRTALEYSGAEVFVDACKDPYRLRHLRRAPELELHVLYLTRDVRGVVLSNLDRGWDATFATQMWLRQQLDILRIAQEFPSVSHVYYEDLTDTVDDTLATIYRFLGLTPQPFHGDFKTVEHHVIGNSMRLSHVSQITKSNRWERELSPDALAAITRTALAFVQRHAHHPLADIIRRYLMSHDTVAEA